MTDLQTNVLYYRDNLEILRRYVPDESVNLIYLDPPLNSNRDYNHLPRRVQQSLRCATARLRGHLARGPIRRVDLPIPDQHRPPRRPSAGQGQHHHRGAALRHVPMTDRVQR